MVLYKWEYLDILLCFHTFKWTLWGTENLLVYSVTLGWELGKHYTFSYLQLPFLLPLRELSIVVSIPWFYKARLLQAVCQWGLMGHCGEHVCTQRKNKIENSEIITKYNPKYTQETWRVLSWNSYVSSFSSSLMFPLRHWSSGYFLIGVVFTETWKNLVHICLTFILKTVIKVIYKLESFVFNEDTIGICKNLESIQLYSKPGGGPCFLMERRID